MTPGAARLGPLARANIDLDGIDGRLQPGPGVNKAGEMMAGIEQAGQQHGGQEP